MLKPTPLRIVCGLLAGLILLFFAAWWSGQSGQICEYDQGTHQNNCSYYSLAFFLLIKSGDVINYYGPLITALATTAIAAFTLTLWQSSEKMWAITKRAADASIDLERPRLLFGELRIRDYNTLGADQRPEPSKNCEYVIENYGKTPAILQSSSVNLRCLQGLPAEPPYRNLKPWQDRVTYNGEKTAPLSVAIPTEDLPLGDALQGFEIFLFGYFIFEDVFGVRRTTGFCYGLIEGSKFVRLRHPAYHYDREESQ